LHIKLIEAIQIADLILSNQVLNKVKFALPLVTYRV